MRGMWDDTGSRGSPAKNIATAASATIPLFHCSMRSRSLALPLLTAHTGFLGPVLVLLVFCQKAKIMTRSLVAMRGSRTLCTWPVVLLLAGIGLLGLVSRSGLAAGVASSPYARPYALAVARRCCPCRRAPLNRRAGCAMGGGGRRGNHGPFGRVSSDIP